jgi:hypothetical protein
MNVSYFNAEMSDIECSNNMFKFKTICKRLGVPIADEQTEGPVTSEHAMGIYLSFIIHVSYFKTK